MNQEALEEELRALEEVERIDWVSENVIKITLRYPRSSEIFLKDPTVEKVRERIKKLLRRGIKVFLGIERSGLIESVEVKSDEADNELLI